MDYHRLEKTLREIYMCWDTVLVKSIELRRGNKKIIEGLEQKATGEEVSMESKT